MMLEALCGCEPYKAGLTSGGAVSAEPANLTAWINDLAADADERYASCRFIAAALSLSRAMRVSARL